MSQSLTARPRVHGLLHDCDFPPVAEADLDALAAGFVFRDGYVRGTFAAMGVELGDVGFGLVGTLGNPMLSCGSDPPT